MEEAKGGGRTSRALRREVLVQLSLPFFPFSPQSSAEASRDRDAGIDALSPRSYSRERVEQKL